jgi:hypothetical protein
MSPSWDLFIILFFVILTVYGLLLGRGRVFNILINAYVGLVIATELGGIAFDYLSGVASIQHSVGLSVFGAKVLIFAAVIFILTMKSELSGANDDASASSFYTAGYGFLAAGLILSSILSFMSEADRANMFSSSNLASMVFSYYYLWLIGPIIFILVTSIGGRLVKK